MMLQLDSLKRVHGAKERTKKATRSKRMEQASACEGSAYRAKFCAPSPSTPEYTLLGVGVYTKGGGHKSPAARGFKIYPSSPPPEKCLLARKGVRGGGCIQYDFSLDQQDKRRGGNKPETNQSTGESLGTKKERQ